MDINQIKENKLKTILRFSIPSIIAMLLETVITITDGYWNHIWNVYPRGWKTCLKGVPGIMVSLRHFFGQFLMNLIYLNQYERKDPLSCPDKEEISMPNSNQTL